MTRHGKRPYYLQTLDEGASLDHLQRLGEAAVAQLLKARFEDFENINEPPENESDDDKPSQL